MRDELEIAIAAARVAAEAIARIYASDFAVGYKEEPTIDDPQGDPVTHADREGNAIIVEALARAFPGDAIVAEESPIPADFARARRCWFVDPLDGTRDFVKRNGEFCVMIGLAIDGSARLGVVALPTTGEIFAGVVRGGASSCIHIGRDGARSTVVRADVDVASPTFVVSRSRRDARLDAIFSRVGNAREMPCGSVGVKVARIVTGDADAYIHLSRPGEGCPKLWDTCAPEAILRALGGCFTDRAGHAIGYARAHVEVREGLVAAMPRLHARLLPAIVDLSS